LTESADHTEDEEYEEPQSSKLLIGGIGPFVQFEKEFNILFHLVESNKGDNFFRDTNPATEVALIGLVAYFEAFCKHQFAALVNILPQLLMDFTVKRGEPTVKFSTILTLKDDFINNLGIILAEQYEFGTAKQINSLFNDLLKVSPFSKEESSTFNEILKQRNLIVHHGGFYTLKYLQDGSISEERKRNMFQSPIRIDTEEFHQIDDFTYRMAAKINLVTVKALKSRTQNIQLTKEQSDAIDLMFRGLYDVFE
jgi:hypothetical protein